MSTEIRRLAHVAVAEALYYSGALALWRWFRRRLLPQEEVCVLGLHRILTGSEQENSNSLDGMIIREDTYLRLLEHMQKRFHVVSLDSLLVTAQQQAHTGKPLCVITFDDGWADTYTRALPGLKKFGLPAVVFLTTGSVGTQGGFWVEHVKRAWRTAPTREQMKAALRQLSKAAADDTLEGIVDWLKRMPTERRREILRRALPANGNAGAHDEVDAMLTWEQAREMSEAGVEIGAHTVSHPLLSYEQAAFVERELKLSKRELELKLGTSVRAFAYPNGDWNEEVQKQVIDAGYRCAFTTRPAWHKGRENLFTIPRVLLHEGNITARNGEFSPAMLDLTLAGWA